MTHKSYHIFTSFPHCYGSVMKPNVNPVTLISKKNIARVANFLFKVKLQALFCCLQLWQKETFSTHFFLGIIRVAVPLIIYFKKALKDYTVKLLYQRLGKHLDIRHLHMLYRVNVLKKMKTLKENTKFGFLLQ